MKLNNFNLQCGLTKDPEVKEITATMLATFSVASQHYKDKSEYYDCKAFGETASKIGTFLKKGSQVILCGRLSQESWKAQDGTSRSKIVLIVDKFYFTTSAKKADESEQQNEIESGNPEDIF